MKKWYDEEYEFEIERLSQENIKIYMEMLQHCNRNMLNSQSEDSDAINEKTRTKGTSFKYMDFSLFKIITQRVIVLNNNPPAMRVETINTGKVQEK